MPIIPVADESQKMVPGSPVPVANSEQARLQADATDKLGQNIAYLGSVLNEVATKENHRQQLMDRMSSVAKMTLLSDQIAAQTADKPEENDPLGIKTQNKFMSSMQDAINQEADNISDPVAKKAFIAEASKDASEKAVSFRAKLIEQKVKENDLKESQVASGFGAMVYQAALTDPTGNMSKIANTFDQSVAKYQLMLAANQDIPQKERDRRLQKFTENAVKEGVDGFKTAHQYDKANAFLDYVSIKKDPQTGTVTGLLDEKTRDDIRTDIGREQDRYYSTIQRQQSISDHNQATAVKVTQNNNYSSLTADQVAAGADPIKQNLVYQKASDLLATGDLRPEQFNAILKNNTFDLVESNNKAQEILQEAITSGKFDEAIQKARDLNGSQLVDKTSKGLQVTLSQLKHATEANPMRTQEVQVARKFLDDMVGEVNKNGNSMQTEQDRANIMASFYTMASKHQVTPTQAAEYAFDSVYGKSLPGGQYHTTKEVEEAQKRIVEDYNAKIKQSGSINPREAIDMDNKLRQLEIRKKKIEFFSAHKQSPILKNTVLDTKE